jgi:serralysin
MEGKLGKLRVETQSSTSRVSAINASKSPAPAAPANGEYADAKAFGLTWQYDAHSTSSGLPFADFDYTGEEFRDKPVFGFTDDWDSSRPGDNNIFNQIWAGTKLAGSLDGEITFGFWDFHRKLGPNANGEHKAFYPFTEAQKEIARDSIAAWDELIAVDFREVEVSSHDARQWAKGDAPDILMANTNSGPAQAWAYLPTSGGNGAWHRSAGDVWIGADPSNHANLWDGGYGSTTQIHELGHSLGLSHPGDYDFGDDNDGDGIPDPITYVGDAFYFQDTLQYSIMSYFDAYESGSNNIDWSVMRFMYAETPMVHDIWVVQNQYGVETTTRTGDSTYGFNWSGDVTNTAMQFTTEYEQAPIFSIWDAGGNDTLDLSGYYTPSVIDLREGAYSSAGGWNAYGDAPVADPSTMTKAEYLAYVNANNAELGMPARSSAIYDNYFTDVAALEGSSWLDIVGRDLLMENNIGIAYGAIIENAIGGAGNDRINGNQATNQFTGNGGSDTFVIADYSGVVTRPTGDVNIDDESVDTIMDFDSGVDKIDLSELGVDWGDLSVSGNTWTVERGADDLSFIVLGEAAVQSDFIFG